jgi:hypothetical protein
VGGTSLSCKKSAGRLMMMTELFMIGPGGLENFKKSQDSERELLELLEALELTNRERKKAVLKWHFRDENRVSS